MSINVFLSWSGTRSKFIAEQLTESLPKILQSLEPWISSHNIESGMLWTSKLAEVLQKYNVGIICLTPENVNEPWINFEAGALSKLKGEGRVCTLLYEIKPEEIAGPLSQFHHTLLDKKSLLKLLLEYNDLQEKPTRKDHITSIFDMVWPDFEKALFRMPSVVELEKKGERSERDILVEILEISRNLDNLLPKVFKNFAEADLRLSQWTKKLEQSEKKEITLSTEDLELMNQAIKSFRELGKLGEKWIPEAS